jgi:hypothetical protein
MNTILNRIDRLMTAITFAEANEPELAQEYAGNRKSTPGKPAPQATEIPGGQILPNQATH